jgi:hypothetical protein
MKRTIILSILMSIICTLAQPKSAQAHVILRTIAGGAGDAGGGSNTKPTFAEIVQTANELTTDYEWSRTSFNLPFWYDEKGDMVFEPRIQAQLDPAVEKVLNKIRYDFLVHRGTPSATPLRFEFKTQGACHGLDGDQEASTKMCASGAPICLSLPLIRARTPKATLKHALEALIMHEVAHQHCADEKVAKKVEHIFSTTMAQNSHLFDAIKIDFFHSKRELTTLRDSLKNSGARVNDTFLCSHIGKYDGLIYSLHWELQATDFFERKEFQKILLEEGLSGGVDLMLGGIRQELFCGDGERSSSSEEIREGDRTGLQRSVEKQLRLLELFKNHFSDYIGITISESMNSEF